MKKLTVTLAMIAGTSAAHAAFNLVPNGDFATAGGANWRFDVSGSGAVTFETTGGAGGATDGYGRLDNTAGAWGGVLVSEGGTGPAPATGPGIPLSALGLLAGSAYDFGLHIKQFSGTPTMAGIKIESWSEVGEISNSGDRNFSITSEWASYTTNYTVNAAATRIKFVPLYTQGAGRIVGFDNVGVTVIPEPSSTLLVGLGALALVGIRRRK